MRFERRNLTDRFVKSRKPAAPGGRDFYPDAMQGFELQVTDKGKKSFYLRKRYPGSDNPVPRLIGACDEISLDDARNTARDWLALIKKGIDPSKEKERAERERREQQERAERETEGRRKHEFTAVAEEYFKRPKQRGGGERRKAADEEREIRRELIGAWAGRQLSDISKEDLREIVEKILERGSPHQARNIYGHARSLFKWAIAADYEIERSPCERLNPKLLLGEKQSRARVLNDTELAAFWRACRRLQYPYRQLFQMLALTGQRKSEVAEACWAEFDPQIVRALKSRKDNEAVDWSKVQSRNKVWTIPAARMKSSAAHVVPLSDDVLRILETLPFFKEGDLLFSQSLGVSAPNAFNKAKARLDRHMTWILKAAARQGSSDPAKITLEPFVIHDIRRTVRTRLSDLRVPQHVAELVIAHTLKGLHKVYDLHLYTDEKREALEKWAAMLRSIVRPAAGNVIALAVARASREAV